MRTSLPRSAGTTRSIRTVRDADDVLRISCDECTMSGTSTCHDCLVTFLVERDALDHEGADGVSLDASEARSLHLFQQVGLAPRLRLSAGHSLVRS